MTLNEYMVLFPDMDMTAFLIGAIVGALISAFFGFRLFRFSVVVSFASAGFLLGYVLFDTLFPDGICACYRQYTSKYCASYTCNYTNQSYCQCANYHNTNKGKK